MHFKELFKAPGRHRGKGMLLIKQAQEEKAGQLTIFPGWWEITDLVLMLALEVNAIETLSGGVGRIVKVRNP